MKPFSKINHVIVGVASVAALFFGTASDLLAQEAKPGKRVALRTADGKYISTAASGGLDVNGAAVSDKTVFAVIDANGGDLADGDEVKIKYTPGQSSDVGKNKPSFWVEEAGVIKRVNAEPKDNSGQFKLKKQDAGFVLETASGKFVGAAKEGGLGLADTAEGGLVLKIEEQPAK